MLKSAILVILATVGLGLSAQQYSSTIIGKVTAVNNVDVAVAVDSTGTIIISTPTHSIYVDRSMARVFGNTLDAILSGMRDLEAKSVTVQDYRTIGKLTSDGSRERLMDGIVFRMEINANKDNKVVMVMYSTRNPEDMRFSTTSLGQLNELVKRALKSGVDYGDQYAYIQSVMDKIGTAVFR